MRDYNGLGTTERGQLTSLSGPNPNPGRVSEFIQAFPSNSPGFFVYNSTFFFQTFSSIFFFFRTLHLTFFPLFPTCSEKTTTLPPPPLSSLQCAAAAAAAEPCWRLSKLLLSKLLLLLPNALESRQTLLTPVPREDRQTDQLG